MVIRNKVSVHETVWYWRRHDISTTLLCVRVLPCGNTVLLTVYVQRTTDVRHLSLIPPTFRYPQYHNILIFRIYKNSSIQGILPHDPYFNLFFSVARDHFPSLVVLEQEFNV
jgi:hypothetical protein